MTSVAVLAVLLKLWRPLMIWVVPVTV